MNEKEIWKDYPLNKNYQISSLGKVRRKGYWKTFTQKSKYRKVHKRSFYVKPKMMKLSKLGNKGKAGNTEYVTCSSIGLVNRAVALTFIPNPNNYPETNHKNGNGMDNRVENLEWVTNSMNQKHAYRTGLRKPNRLIDKKTGRYVKKYN